MAKKTYENTNFGEKKQVKSATKQLKKYCFR